MGSVFGLLPVTIPVGEFYPFGCILLEKNRVNYWKPA